MLRGRRVQAQTVVACVMVLGWQPGEPGDRDVVEAESTTANEQGCVRQRLRAANGSREGGRTALLSPTQRYECTRAFGYVHG